MLEPWRTGKVVRIEDITPITKRFWIAVDDLERFDFKPGQFVTLDLPIDEKRNKRWRSYSIASWPDGTNVIELVIVLLEGGRGTHYLFNEVSEGSELTLRGPQGVFTLPETLEKDIFLICTGTGIAPFRSMVNYIHGHNVPHKDIHLIFGCRRTMDCLYGVEMKELEKELEGFSYIPTFSREHENPADIRKGYVHAVYEEIVTKNQLAPASFYLCGWKDMIDQAKQKILSFGYDKHDIHLELYG